MMLPFLLIMIFLPDKILYAVPAPWSWLMAGGQLLAVLGLLQTIRQTGASYFIGLSQLRGESDASSTKGELVIKGFYRYIRHPLYFFAVLFLWLSPLMTENLLAFNILATIYFYLGARHEERSLQEEFGQEYEHTGKMYPCFCQDLDTKANKLTFLQNPKFNGATTFQPWKWRPFFCLCRYRKIGRFHITSRKASRY